jgi:Gpi18-like mannosyltransferase
MLNFSPQKRELIFLVVLITVAFIVRVLLFPLQGYQNDMGTFQYWFNTAAENGIRPFYTVVLQQVGWIDYPPFNVYIFWIFGTLSKALSAWGVHAANIVKLAPNIFDMATTGLIYFFLRKQLTFKQSIIGTGLYVFNPALIFNAAVWGQFDAIYSFFLLLSVILAIKGKPEASAVVFAIGLLTKPQSIALLPLIAVLIFKKEGVKRFLTSISAFAGTVFLVILPFEWSSPVTFLSDIYFGAYGGYKYTSINAFNLWGMFGLWLPDTNFYLIGWMMFGAFAIFTVYVLYKRFNVSGDTLAIFSAFMLFFAFFMLPTRIHERYLFPAISMLALLFPLAKRTRIFYFVLTATLFVNQAYVLSFLNSPNPFIPTGDLVVIAVSVINLIMFLYGSLLLWNEFRGRSIQDTTDPNKALEQNKTSIEEAPK